MLCYFSPATIANNGSLIHVEYSGSASISTRKNDQNSGIDEPASTVRSAVDVFMVVFRTIFNLKLARVVNRNEKFCLKIPKNFRYKNT